MTQKTVSNSPHYAVISGKAPDLDDRVTTALTGLNLLGISETYPVLLALFEKRMNGVIDGGQLAHSVEMMRGFILRRFICGKSTNGYDQLFMLALSNDNGDPVKGLEAYLLDRGWPDDPQFMKAFAEFPLYEEGYNYEVLTTIERARGQREPADIHDAQVERVMPSTLNEAWRMELDTNAESIHAEFLNRPGNLTLSSYDQELWKNAFNIKRVRYGQSNIVLTRELARHTHWGASEIEARGQALAIEAAKIWIGPKEKIKEH